MKLTDDEIRHVAHLARLGLSEDEVPRFRGELATILEHVSAIGELDLDDVPATNHPLGLVDLTGEDVPRPSLSRDEALAGAPDPTDTGFRVPRVAPGEVEA